MVQEDFSEIANLSFGEKTEISISENFIDLSNKVSLKVIKLNSNNKNLPILVLVPGWISRFNGWKEFVSEAVKCFQVIYIETREKSSSTVPKNCRIGVEEIAEDLALIIEKLKLENDKFLLMGSSLGATAIVESFRFMKTKPRKIVLMGPNVHFLMPWWGKILINYSPILFSEIVKEITLLYVKHFRVNYKSDPEQFEKYAMAIRETNVRKLRLSARAFQGYKIWNSAKFVNKPSLTISAKKDKLHEPKNIDKLYEKLVLQNKFSEIIYFETNKDAHKKEVVQTILKFWEK